ncbi:unnamed protein product (macronuclear) [Paramecium tetraurelia]|uniref:protein-tyrosine-phosphatase n=1 Tax=Paramecium tetraurelia TaxID=5888 RepID=A0DJT4_PARTE|nr:uncharacterized protein GSPATT00017645001 [Paramecium tetraurelia]CAK83301.1 unnamed protein product [Paramecium tetraurelia]|eukprot:XP_001450698.1 hypothetical protein (macronuclear) [Paramecium tetraurelia strain d4-2]
MKNHLLLVNVNEMDLIIENNNQQGALWLGNLRAAQNITKLIENNIKTVITVANNLFISFKQNLNIRHKIFKVEDSEKAQIINHFEEINNEILNGLNHGSVLVHCVAGISRSSACVIAFIMKTHKWTYEKTFYYVKEKRLVINPNRGFKKQLIQYHNILQSEIKPQNKPFIECDGYQLGKINSWSKLHKKNVQNPQELIKQLSQNLIKTPVKKIDQLNRTSTPEERQIYRQQLAKKLFVNTFANKSTASISHYSNDNSVLKQKSSDQQTVKIKAFLSMYKKVDMSDMQSDRINFENYSQ